MKFEEAVNCMVNLKPVYYCTNIYSKINSFVPVCISTSFDNDKLLLHDNKDTENTSHSVDIEKCFHSRQEAGMNAINFQYRKIDDFIECNNIELIAPEPKGKKE